MRKALFIVVLVNLFSGCLTKEKYIVGKSITERVDFEDFIQLYLNAICRRDQDVLSVLVKAGPYLTVFSDVEVNIIPEACKLKIKGVSYDHDIEPPESLQLKKLIPGYIVLLEDEETGKEYIFSFFVIRNRIYLDRSLEERYNPERSYQGP